MKIETANKITNRLLSEITPEEDALAEAEFGDRTSRENLADILHGLADGMLTDMLEALVTQAAEGSPAEALGAARNLSGNLALLFGAAGDILEDDDHGG